MLLLFRKKLIDIILPMEIRNKTIILSEKDGMLDDTLNVIKHEGKNFTLNYISEHKFSKGGNSNVYILKDTDKKEKDKVIKICNISRPGPKAPSWIVRRYGRFLTEINVLNELKDKEKENIVRIEFDGVIILDGYRFPYYVMEKADTDLKEYLLNNQEIDEQEKVKLCLNIYDAIKELHDEGYYHRDIKPDNILLFYSDDTDKVTWKLGDLGLIAHRDKDYDDVGEKIGPIGWLSPEAMNKLLTEKVNLGFDCSIDEKSDIFQLGKLFWFIFQRNVPIGQIKFSDFICKMKYKQDMYELINDMLIYSKEMRSDRELVDVLLGDLARKYAVD